MASSTDTGGIGRAGALMASGTVVSRLLGFLSAILLARTLGTVGSGADAFALANQLPNNIYALIAGGVLTAVLVPQIVKASAGEDGGAGYINKIVTLGFVIFLALTALATLLAPVLVLLYAQESGDAGRGFSDADIALATALAYWCLPQVLFYALYSLFGEVLNARSVFGPFTWAPVLNNVVVITGLLIFGQLFSHKDPADALEWTPGMTALLGGGATAGIALQALILLVFWKRAGIRYRPDFAWRGVGLAHTGKAAGWLFGMILIAQVAGVVQANVATLATSDGEAGLAILRFSWLLFMVPHSVITVSLATAYFTRMSNHASAGEMDSVREDLSNSTRRVGLMMVIASAGLIVLSVPFAKLFGGQADEVWSMAQVIAAYSVGLVAFSVVFVVQRVYYALGDTRTPFFFQLAHAAVFISLAVVVSGFDTAIIAPSLALAASIASWVQLVVALALLRKKLGGLRLIPLVGSLGLFVLLAAVASIPGVWIVLSWGGVDPAGFVLGHSLGALVTLAVGAGVMTVIYLGGLLVLRNNDAKVIVSGAVRLIRRVFTR